MTGIAEKLGINQPAVCMAGRWGKAVVRENRFELVDE